MRIKLFNDRPRDNPLSNETERTQLRWRHDAADGAILRLAQWARRLGHTAFAAQVDALRKVFRDACDQHLAKIGGEEP